MWRLLKTQWSEAKYPLIMTLIFPASFFIYGIVQKLDEWPHEPSINELVAILMGITFGFMIMELVYRQSAKEKSALFFLTRLPIEHGKLHAIRLLSGSALVGSVITLIAMIILFFMKDRIGDRYITIAAFHGLLLSSQILAVITEDVIHKWFKMNSDLEGLCIIFVPAAFLFTLGAWIVYPTRVEDYISSLTEVIVLNLFPFVFLALSFMIFQRRKSYLP